MGQDSEGRASGQQIVSGAKLYQFSHSISGFFFLFLIMCIYLYVCLCWGFMYLTSDTCEGTGAVDSGELLEVCCELKSCPPRVVHAPNH